jgi:hypothetical protein
MKIRITIFLSLAIMLSCNNETPNPSLDELIEVEKQFSDMSLNQGMVAAFLHFCDEEGVLLRSNSYPIVGRDQVAELVSNTPDSLFTLTWKPSSGMIANSGELGYTYGIYTMSFKSEELPNTLGTYLTIWKKNEEGNWRFLMDTGQEGLE